MNRFWSRSAASAATAALSLALAACTTTPPPPDASDDAADVVTDQPDPPYNSPLFGRCRNDGDCASGTRCKTESAAGWSNGFCTRECTASIDCEAGAAPGVAGYCGEHDGERICLRECLNGFDCSRPGFTCEQYDPTDTSMMPLRVCRPSCTENSCVQGTVCNFWTGRCQPSSAPLPPAGQDNGESCTQMGSMNTCRSGQCVPAQNSRGVYTGWNNGYCTSSCTLTAGWNSAQLWPGTEFPRANCPMGSICFPDGEPGIAERDPGTCYKECRSDADCRVAEGYACRRTFNRGMRPFTWSNGICLPRACDPAPGARDECPSGFYCEAQVRVQGTMRVTVGVCRPGTRPVEPGPEPTVEPGPEPTVEPGPEPAMEAGTEADSAADSATAEGGGAGFDGGMDASDE
jgi:hypothetical protein